MLPSPLGNTTPGQAGYKILGIKDIKTRGAGLGPVGGDDHDYLQESSAVGAEHGNLGALLTPKEFVKEIHRNT